MFHGDKHCTTHRSLSNRDVSIPMLTQPIIQASNLRGKKTRFFFFHNTILGCSQSSQFPSTSRHVRFSVTARVTEFRKEQKKERFAHKLIPDHRGLGGVADAVAERMHISRTCQDGCPNARLHRRRSQPGQIAITTQLHLLSVFRRRIIKRRAFSGEQKGRVTSASSSFCSF